MLFSDWSEHSYKDVRCKMYGGDFNLIEIFLLKSIKSDLVKTARPTTALLTDVGCVIFTYIDLA